MGRVLNREGSLMQRNGSKINGQCKIPFQDTCKSLSYIWITGVCE